MLEEVAAKGTKVPITPSVLEWAILESGMASEEVAAAIKVPVEMLEDWATGADQPLLSKFRSLAEKLHRPAATFFLPKPPDSSGRAVRFRAALGSDRTALNKPERRWIRETQRLLKTLDWISRELGYPELDLGKTGESAQSSARKFREQLGISASDQRSWSTGSSAFRAWRDALSEKHVLVFALSLGADSCRGFSLRGERVAIAAVNTNKLIPEARIFTALHEVGHIIRRDDTACWGGGYSGGREKLKGEERWCEQFASNVLLPKAAVEAELARLGRAGEEITDLNDVREVAQRLKVSQKATVIRLIDMNLASWDLFDEIPQRKFPERVSGQGRKLRKIREDGLGERAIQIVVEGAREGIVSSFDGARILDVSNDDFREWERRIW